MAFKIFSIKETLKGKINAERLLHLQARRDRL